MRRGMLLGGFAMVVASIVLFITITVPMRRLPNAASAPPRALASPARVLDAHVSPAATVTPLPLAAAPHATRPEHRAKQHAHQRPVSHTVPQATHAKQHAASLGTPHTGVASVTPRPRAPLPRVAAARTSPSNFTVVGEDGPPVASTQPVATPEPVPSVAQAYVERAQLEAAARYVQQLAHSDDPSAIPTDIEAISSLDRATIIVTVTSGPNDSQKDRYVLGRDPAGFYVVSRELTPRPSARRTR